MRLVIRKSVLLELAKGMNEDSFEKIKAAIIAHLKGLEEQEESGDLKKAITYFSDNESMFSHLEKSLSGEWIEKAGYGIGTVRTWRGKKYKKIAQGKWVRVYDKVDRGAKNAMTRLIHQAENIDTPEEMMRFVLANKQRFSDANGKPLDIVDRLNAVIDNKEYKNESSKKSAANTNKKTPAQPKTGKNTEKPAKTSGNSSFGLDDIKSGKKVKTVAEMEDVAKQIADKYEENGHKAESVWIDFMAYNLDGGMGGDLATDFMQKHGDVNFQTLIKKLSGKKLSAKERNPEFADEYANMEEEKSTKKKKASNASVFSPSDSADIDKKEVIAEPVSQSDGTVEFPKTKETKTEFEQLAKCVSKEKKYYFMQSVYYDKKSGVLVSTDARRLKFIKVGDLTGFDKSCYVDVDTKGKNIAITRNDVMTGNAEFPNYKKVIPNDSSMKIRANLDNRVLAEKIKAMKEDGSVSKRDGKGILDIISIDFEKNGDVMLDRTKVGSIGKQDTDLPPLYMNVHYLTDAISAGKTSVLSLQEPNANGFTRAMTMNTGCSSSIIMPSSNSVDYEERRAEAKQLKAKKDKKITNRLELNKKLIKKDKENFYLSPDKIKEKIETISTLSDEDLSRNLKFANVDLDLLAKKYDFSNPNRNVKETGLSVFHTVRTKIAFDKYPEIKAALDKEMQKRGISTQVKKSDSLYEYVQKSIAALKACRAI